MKVIVASKNPTKLASTKQAFDHYFKGQKITYASSEVASGVSDQPMSIEETIQGAINRAKAASSPDADFSVGIEGGMSFYKIGGHEYAVELSWVCVYDCQTGTNEIASSAGFPVFPKVIKHLHNGQNLTQAMAKEYGLQDLGQKNGYIGWLSGDVITRQSSNYEAVYLALSSLMKEEQT